LHVAELVEASERAALLHVSTCYVAGRRYGQIAEEVRVDLTPLGGRLDAARECADAYRAAEAIVAEHESPARERALIAQTEELVRERRTGELGKLVANLAKRRQREELKEALQDEGMRRAAALGWPNTYTYSKALAEALLAARKGLRYAIVRPSIVESALEYPFPGWNESFNGSAPLAYVMGSWFRMVPAKPDAPFDVVPVDLVARAMFIAGSALLEGRSVPVYHVGTSDLHPCSVGRAAELIVLAHRKHYREQGTRSERVLKSRFDAVLVEPDHWLSVERNRELLGGLRTLVDLLPDKLLHKARRLTRRLEDSDKKLAQIERLVGLYLPFMYESFYVFEARALSATEARESVFRFEPQRIDWRKYWIDVHVPGLRRWAFPLIEGKRPERYKPAHPVRLPEEAPPPPRRPLKRRIQPDRSLAES
jgi:long-chain acyl-CoA synthetase